MPTWITLLIWNYITNICFYVLLSGAYQGPCCLSTPPPLRASWMPLRSFRLNPFCWLVCCLCGSARSTAYYTDWLCGMASLRLLWSSVTRPFWIRWWVVAFSATHAVVSLVGHRHWMLPLSGPPVLLCDGGIYTSSWFRWVYASPLLSFVVDDRMVSISIWNILHSSINLECE
jgi:hypothetical protein